MNGAERAIRVLLVGRYFWPLGSIDAAGHLVELATGFQLAGMKVSVLTAKHGVNQSDMFTFRDFPVYRPVRLFRSGWVTHRHRGITAYVQTLRDWMVNHGAGYDVIVSDAAREESIAVIQAARELDVPAVVRLAGQGEVADIHYHGQSRQGKRCRAAIADADAIVFADAAQHRQWLADGGAPERCWRIPTGIPPLSDDRGFTRENLRRAMARINGDLLVPDSTAVVLTVERMVQGSGIQTLVESAYSLSTQLPGLQFWLIGDGPMRDAIFSHLKGDGLRQMMAMPGSFAVLRDVFACADVMVHRGDAGFEFQIPCAISSGLPLVVADTETSRMFFGCDKSQSRERLLTKRSATVEPTSDSEHPPDLVWWFDPLQPKTLRFAIDQIVRHRNAARRRADRLRRSMIRSRSFDDTIRSYQDLLGRLASERTAQARSGASSGETP